MMKIIVICLMLLGCATPGLWRYDKLGDVQNNTLSNGVATLGYGKTDSHYIDLKYNGTQQAFSVYANTGNESRLRITKITKTEDHDGGIRWDGSSISGEIISISPEQVRVNEVICDVTQITYMEIKQFREGSYVPEKVVGRVILTPFAVAADVVVVATSIIWFPLTIWLCKDMKNIN
jgi:hypothetical protein